MTFTVNAVAYFLLIGSVFIGLIRFIKGPDVLNRVIAFDLVSISLIGIVIVFSEEENSSFYIEMILVFCLLGFASAVVLMESLYRSYLGEKKDA